MEHGRERAWSRRRRAKARSGIQHRRTIRSPSTAPPSSPAAFEAGTIDYFDRVLPHCDRMIDFGAYIGFTALHAASRGAEVYAFEPNPAVA